MSSPKKLKLSEAELPEISLYVHWPFCASKCPYCDFNSHESREINRRDWLKAFLIELKSHRNSFSGKNLRSIFFGGGTPSLMPVEIVAQIIENVRSFVLNDNFEVTLEANPTSSESQKFQEFKEAGVNRVSLGVQSFFEDELKFLGRNHSVKDAMQAIELAGKIFPKFSFDLIYALPNQTFAQFEKNLDIALKFGSTHLSLYQLTIEKGTKFFSDVQKNVFQEIEDEAANELYFKTNEKLAKNDFLPYEISNYSKNNDFCQHNLQYWQYGEYVGIGAGAHGRLHLPNFEIQSTMTIHSPENWLNNVLQKGSGLQKNLKLSRQEILDEMLIFCLRIDDGLQNAKLQNYFGKEITQIWSSSDIALLVNQGLIELKNDSMVATERGKLLLSNLVSFLSDKAIL